MEKAFGSKTKMAPTLIKKCPNCNGLMLTSSQQKTKTCPYCGKNVNLQKAQQIAKANSAMEASEMLKQLKAKRGVNPKPV
jgi:DNA-directed RNA polymerase subunit M/transcription elongation factor TFIIS